MFKFYHSSGYVLAALTPLAFVLSPSPLNVPVDALLSVLFPLHSHIALNFVIGDYVPKALRGTARVGLFAVTFITIGGLLKLSVDGPGLTQSIKSLWVPVPQKK